VAGLGQPELGADENINNGVHTEHIKAKYQNCCLLQFVEFCCIFPLNEPDFVRTAFRLNLNRLQGLTYLSESLFISSMLFFWGGIFSN